MITALGETFASDECTPPVRRSDVRLARHGSLHSECDSDGSGGGAVAILVALNVTFAETWPRPRLWVQRHSREDRGSDFSGESFGLWILLHLDDHRFARFGRRVLDERRHHVHPQNEQPDSCKRHAHPDERQCQSLIE